MSEAKYGKTMISSIVPVFRFAHTRYWLKTYTFNRTPFRFNCISSLNSRVAFSFYLKNLLILTC
ncbi:hypothetical protein C2L93_03385 [Coxiella burnetii]|nr:hypothetical protein C2L93_03385 [Coxiella burnetii]